MPSTKKRSTLSIDGLVSRIMRKFEVPTPTSSSAMPMPAARRAAMAPRYCPSST